MLPILKQERQALYFDNHKYLILLFIGQFVFRWRLQYTQAECQADTIGEALRAIPPNVNAATHTICSLTAYEMEDIKRAYLALFGTTLEYDVEERTNGVEKDVSCSVLSPNFD